MGLTLRTIGRVFCGLVLTLCLMLVTVPLVFSLIASFGLVCLLSLAKERYALALVASAVLSMFGLLELGLRVIPPDASPHYFRPHELLAGRAEQSGLVNYRPNESVENFHIHGGDLAALSGIKAIAEPRTVDFHTDSLGFRNREDYRGQPLVLIGDSFVVGNGNSQDAILSEVLMREHQIAAYNAGYPDGIDGYEKRLKLLQQRHGSDFRAIVVVFEGNDFPCPGERSRPASVRAAEPPAPSIADATRYVPKPVRELESYRLFFSLTRRAHYAWSNEGAGSIVHVEQFGGKDVGFLASEVRQAKEQLTCDWLRHRRFFKSIASRVALLVFVPTKYRVYGSLPKAGRETLPASPAAAFMAALAHSLQLPYLDLTPELISASGRLLEVGQYTFWRGDTHWNENGIRVAADAIAARLREEGLAPAN